MSDDSPSIVNADDTELRERLIGAHWGGRFKALTPTMRERGGRLGVNQMIVPPGRACVPFHAHRREDEIFYVLSGRGVLRYGETLTAIRAGDCIACPAGTGVAHQIANNGDEDLVYLAIGTNDPDEVCVYPDSGKVMVRSIGIVGRLEKTEYLDGEPERPKVFDLIDAS